MYSRKSRGYMPYSPPPNYNGVAFTRDFSPSAVLDSASNQDDGERDAAASKPSLPDAETAYREEEEGTEYARNTDELDFDEYADIKEANAYSDEPYSSSSDSEETEAEQGTDDDSNDLRLSSAVVSKEFTLEDLLIIGSVLLFVSGELDGDLMLLLGLLLIAGL